MPISEITRSTLPVVELPRSTRGRGGLLFAVLLLCGLAFLPTLLHGRAFELRLLTLIFLYSSMAQAWNLLGGYAGQTSIGHALFFGLGAYTSTLASIYLGLNPWLGGILAVVVATCAGVLIGWPCFRLKSHYFVIATLVV